MTDNMYASEARPIYFISDPPHLMKTLRNNLEGSRFGGRRCLWVCEDFHENTELVVMSISYIYKC